MPLARCVSTPCNVVVVVVAVAPVPVVTVMSPPLSAAWSCAGVGCVMPAASSVCCASASAIFTLPQPIGLVGTSMVVVVVTGVVEPAGVVVVVSVAAVPLRNA